MKITVVLTAKEPHADKFEQYNVLKFDAPEREAQPGLATRDPLAHLQIAVTRDAAEELAPVLERHAVGIVPHLATAGPDGQPEIFIEGRRYVLTIEPDEATAAVAAAASQGGLRGLIAKLRKTS